MPRAVFFSLLFFSIPFIFACHFWCCCYTIISHSIRSIWAWARAQNALYPNMLEEQEFKVEANANEMKWNAECQKLYCTTISCLHSALRIHLRLPFDSLQPNLKTRSNRFYSFFLLLFLAHINTAYKQWQWFVIRVIQVHSMPMHKWHCYRMR